MKCYDRPNQKSALRFGKMFGKVAPKVQKKLKLIKIKEKFPPSLSGKFLLPPPPLLAPHTTQKILPPPLISRQSPLLVNTHC